MRLGGSMTRIRTAVGLALVALWACAEGRRRVTTWRRAAA
jgi:hypothetical protein